MRDTIDMAREACPYTSVELRGAFYDGFMRAAALVRADERKQFGKECVAIVASYAGHDAFGDPRAFDAIEALEFEIREEMERQP
jgi:hypothetical protein